MNILLHILMNNVLPLTVMIAVGMAMEKAFKMDIKTLSKLNFYVFSPAIMFNLLYRTDIPLKLFGQVMLFVLCFLAAQYAVLEAVVRIRQYDGGMRSAMRNSVLFYNSANYGIPLNQLAFAGNPYTLSVQILVMMTQSLIPNTYGVYNVNAHKAKWKDIRKVILSMPVIYVIPVALALRYFEVSVPGPIETPIGYLADAFIGTALLTLGVQLGGMKWRVSRSMAADVGISVFLRLVIGPALAALVVWALGIHGMMAAALIVSSAVPTSLSSVLLAVEFDNESEFASQTVFVSTVVSIVSVTTVIYLLHL
ncbi:AEC family transporter [Cohnella faecalis]|uniref:AEC family transporter n=1 Tax=Cohnella faecalis TaxID=2315694 RepID=A0A398CFX0_9BACL|nr:AEC family transporter [Cohnella faecalis]RIE00802.1 AEC family transporter [Cohnella faecalis]